jgi:murein L,D-transpeptidase YcbB/YkuD
MPGCGVIPISILQSISATAQNQNINQPISQQQNVQTINQPISQQQNIQTINQPSLQQQNDQIKIDNNLNQNNSPKEEITDNFKFNKTLKFGVRDDSVVELQKFLNNNGFLVSKNGAGSPGKETKYFGFYTRKALIDFQKSNNIKPANGYLGSATIKKINNFK